MSVPLIGWTGATGWVFPDEATIGGDRNGLGLSIPRRPRPSRLQVTPFGARDAPGAPVSDIVASWGPVPDRPSPPNGCTPTTEPTMERLR